MVLETKEELIVPGLVARVLAECGKESEEDRARLLEVVRACTYYLDARLSQRPSFPEECSVFDKIVFPRIEMVSESDRETADLTTTFLSALTFSMQGIHFYTERSSES